MSVPNVQEPVMFSITHIVFAYLHFVPGGNGGWTQGSDYPRFSADERAAIRLPFEGFWQRVN